MSPDAKNTITHHPNVYNLQRLQPPASRSSSKGPAARDASSTGVEAVEVTDHDPVERHHSAVTDVESQFATTRNSRVPRLSAESDPYGLSLAYKTDSDLEQDQGQLIS